MINFVYEMEVNNKYSLNDFLEYEDSKLAQVVNDECKYIVNNYLLDDNEHVKCSIYEILDDLNYTDINATSEYFYEFKNNSLDEFLELSSMDFHETNPLWINFYKFYEIKDGYFIGYMINEKNEVTTKYVKLYKESILELKK